MTPRVVLIFSTDVLAGALLGAAVELVGGTVQYPRADEGPREALLRLRPAVALVDCDHETACTESCFCPAVFSGAPVALLWWSRSRRTLDPIAEEFGVRSFGLPIDFAELSEIVQGR
jgi:hypothetical protein